MVNLEVMLPERQDQLRPPPDETPPMFAEPPRLERHRHEEAKQRGAG